MGLLTEGKPLVWADSIKFIEYIKKHGVHQFLHLWHEYRLRSCDEFKWGDEVEYLLVYTPKHRPNTAKLLLRSKEIQNDANAYLKQMFVRTVY